MSESTKVENTFCKNQLVRLHRVQAERECKLGEATELLTTLIPRVVSIDCSDVTFVEDPDSLRSMFDFFKVSDTPNPHLEDLFHK